MKPKQGQFPHSWDLLPPSSDWKYRTCQNKHIIKTISHTPNHISWNGFSPDRRQSWEWGYSLFLWNSIPLVCRRVSPTLPLILKCKNSCFLLLLQISSETQNHRRAGKHQLQRFKGKQKVAKQSESHCKTAHTGTQSIRLKCGKWHLRHIFQLLFVATFSNRLTRNFLPQLAGGPHENFPYTIWIQSVNPTRNFKWKQRLVSKLH